MQKTGKTGYPSIDKPWLKYYSEEAINAAIPECTVFENILQHNKEYPDGTALDYLGRKIAFKEMFRETELCAKALMNAGIQPGDCVTLCTAGVPEAVYVVLACSKIGAIANFINPTFTTNLMIERINDTESTILFTLDHLYGRFLDTVIRTSIQRVVLFNTSHWLSWPKRVFAPRIEQSRALKEVKGIAEKYEDFILGGSDYSGNTSAPYQRDTPALMVYSSGTTGASKGILLTNDGINATISHYLSPEFPYTRGATFLQMIPVWFSTGIVLSVLMPLCLGITVILEPKFSKESFAKNLAKYRPIMTLATMSFWEYAVGEKGLKYIDFSSMRYPITGGEKVLPEAEQKVNSFLKSHGCPVRMIKGWGMCELGSTITSTSPKYSKFKSAGYPIQGVEVAAFDRSTNSELKYNNRGELYVFSLARMKGYYQNETATKAFFWIDPNGKQWGRTGDIGYIDQDGNVFVKGRASDCYTAQDNTTVYLFDIEDVILDDLAVAQCKVVAVGKDGQQALAAHIVLNQGNKEKAEDIIKRIDGMCRMKLADNAIPKGYKIWDALPIHSNGKRDVESLKLERDGFMDAQGSPAEFCNLAKQTRKTYFSKKIDFSGEDKEYIIPFYINTDRLLDLCAIQSEGYSEYAEITSTRQNSIEKNISGEIEAGVKLWKIADLSAEADFSKNEEDKRGEVKHQRLVQTAASMLHFYLKKAEVKVSWSGVNSSTEAKLGDIECIIGHLVEPKETSQELAPQYLEKIQSKPWRKTLIKLYGRFNGIEDRAPAIFETDYVSELTQNWTEPEKIRLQTMISRKYLYQCELNDLWEIEIYCLCKVVALGEHPKIEIIALFC